MLRLQLGESPFYANYGIPAQQSVVQQIHPDYYVARTQAQFAPFFASLSITPVIPTPVDRLTRRPVPTYKVDILTNSGFRYPTFTVPVNQVPR